MDSEILNKQSQHWENNFSSKPEMFGTSPSDPASYTLEIFKKNNVKVLVLDWTKPNKNIKKFLTKKQRYGIPYNEIYGPLLLNGKILSELLTIREIQKYIKIAK